jgi:hypothetical protein
LFTSPTRDLRQVDIVISVTPRVLRAPAVTPRDEEMRPSGTLQSPTTGSLAEMIREADREDQIAAARALPRNAVVQLPDAPVEVAKSATSTVNSTAATVAQNNNPQPTTTAANPPATTPVNTETVAANTSSTTTQPAPAQVKPPVDTATVAQNTSAPAAKAPAAGDAGAVEELPSFVPAPKSLISDRAAAEVATVNPGGATQNAVLTSLPKTATAALDSKSPEARSLDTKLGASRVAQLSLLQGDDVMKVGENRRYAVQLNSDVSLSLALLTLKFDPKVVKVNAVSAGSLLSTTGEGAPLFTPSIDATGVCMISISSLNGKASFRGSGALLFIDVEAIGAGNAELAFVKETLHLVATDARDVTSEIVQGTATVKQ